MCSSTLYPVTKTGEPIFPAQYGQGFRLFVLLEGMNVNGFDIILDLLAKSLGRYSFGSFCITCYWALLSHATKRNIPK